MLEGYKTYISAVLVVLSGILFWAGVIDQTAFASLIAIFMGSGVAGLRAAVKKGE